MRKFVRNYNEAYFDFIVFSSLPPDYKNRRPQAVGSCIFLILLITNLKVNCP